MSKHSALFIGIALLLISCGKDRIFEEYHSFDSGNWEQTDSIKFDLSTLDSLFGSAVVGIRHTEEYPFSNCYIKILFKDSSNHVLLDSLWNVPLYDRQTGKPLGDGFGNTFTSYDTLTFPIPIRTKEAVFLQYMRQPKLEGVEAIGLKIVGN